MKQSVPAPGGRLEYSVMVEVWELGEATAREVHARVGEPKGLAYTTIAKVLERLRVKGLLSRRRLRRAFRYRPKFSRDRVERARARMSLRTLLGSDPVPAMATLVEAVESLDPALLDELSRLVAARRRTRDGS
jgi:BlaI family transcriptional regulator, penicillinase repressor